MFLGSKSQDKLHTKKVIVKLITKKSEAGVSEILKKLN